ncbi:putative nucleic acid-binding protein [Knoellia remsis]|uniref:Ribonuclease VapC n=1 Tax=Knoellia remsis TaxID=407159 RepID=A0A2T0UN53_9MICO|nr:type II toxin-antitoxin system VapC family toxin [Knoellia remsis]PRY59351.1 putative nucleic acid-binding protein [Knoellia remsis]
MTVVVDASALVDLLVASPKQVRAAQALRGAGELLAPDLLFAEVTSALARMHRAGRLTEDDARRAIDDLVDFPVTSVPHRALTPAVWGLRHNIRVSDAYYVSLAQEFGAPLVTSDLRLARGASGVAIVTIT